MSDIQSDKLKPSYDLYRDETHHEVHFTIAGLWPTEEMADFLEKLARAAYPFVMTNKPWSVMADLQDFVPQAGATAESMKENIEIAKNNGLVRYALVNPPPIVRLQHRRVAGDLEIEAFESREDACAWLRS